MDTDEVIVIYDDDDQKDADSNDQFENSQCVNDGYSESKITFGDSDNVVDINTEGIYDDLDDINMYINEEEVYSGEDEEYIIDDDQCIQTTNSSKVKSGTKHSDNTELTKVDKQTEKNVDEVIVNSHLQEIVDIKNQIKELQDILHEKQTTGNEKLKQQEPEENEVSEIRVKAQSKNIHLKRNLLIKNDARKKIVKRVDGSQLSVKTTPKMLLTERFKMRAEAASREKYLKMRGAKQFERENETSTGFHSGLPQIFQKKKISNEAGKLRLEKKSKAAIKEAVVEDSIDTKLHEIENIPPSVTSSLRKILQMTAHTPEEKYKVLDARDKLYKIMRDKDPTIKTGSLVGTCPDMCPEKERLQREFQFQVHMFEMVNYPEDVGMNHNHAVKQYCRSSADQEGPLPHELRPVSVLSMTMSYLLNNVADRCELSDHNLEEWYTFMWDRTRALRKELTQQGACNLETVKLVEQCARFHIHCAERLVDQDSSIYDDKINTENLTKCLQTLKYMYKDLANEDIFCPNESEFVCYSLLLNLNNISVFTELSDMAERVMSSEPVRFALDIMAAWETRNYVRFFNLVKSSTYLNCCLLRRYFNEMRLYAIKAMIRSYCTKYYSPQIPIYRFVESLSFEGVKECCNFLTECNFDFNEKSDSDVTVNLNREAFRNPETPFSPCRALVIIGGKKKRPLSVIMAGGELPPKTYENHVLQDSFSSAGELKLDSLLCKELMDFAMTPSAPPVPPPLATKAKTLEFKGETSKSFKDPVNQYTDIFGKVQKFGQDSVEKKYPDDKSLFSRLGDKQTGAVEPSSTSIFGKNFGGSNIFSSNLRSEDGGSSSSLFGSKSSNFFSGGSFVRKTIFGSENSEVFGPSPTFFVCSNKKEEELPNSCQIFQRKSEGSGFQFKVSSPPAPPSKEDKLEEEERKKNEEMEKMKRESEMTKQKEREEEEERKLRNLLIESMKKSKEEAERREKERKEAEEEERRERERREMEERKRLEEAEEEEEEEAKKQEKMRKARLMKLEEKARIEAEKRKSDADFRLKLDKKMLVLKRKYIMWKVGEFFNKWRLKAWVTIESRKMKEYFKEVHLRYPDVCTEEDLNGNPYGLVIPNVLILRKCQSRKIEDSPIKNQRSAKLEMEELSFVNIKEIVAKPLEIRSKRLFNRVDPFLWKVVFSVPDESESRSWKDIETFIEMNFVDRINWRFGKEKGALCYHEGCRSSFRYKISVRRVRGTDLYEGEERNPHAVTGSNALIFVLSDDADIKVAKDRLTKVLSSRSPLPRIPLIIFALGQNLEELENELELNKWLETHVTEYHVEKSYGNEKDDIMYQLVNCLKLGAEKSGAITPVRIIELSDFCSTNWFECVWRRIETGLSNYKIIISNPNYLVDCYNGCIDELSNIFSDREGEKYTLIGREFSGKTFKRPEITESYRRKIMEYLKFLKLPFWPDEIPKSSNELKYQIHQYCKKVTGERKKVKELKWLLYRIIRTSLLWKGLDIYCDEDIDSILFNFPWIQFFQELSRFTVKELTGKIQSRGEELTIVYRIDKMEKFSYESSLIGKILDKSKDEQRNLLEETDSSPCVEHDSVIFAYTAALERERNKRKREDVAEENIEDVFDLGENKRQILEEDEKPKVDVSVLKKSFQSMSNKLDEMKKRMEESAKALKELEGNL